MLSSHRLSETTKVLFAQQRENVILVVLVICEMKEEGIVRGKELQK